MGIDINSLDGVSKELALLLANNKNSKTLDGSAASIFTKVDTTVKDLIKGGNLNFTKIYQAVHNVVVAVKEFFGNNFNKIVSFCKKLTNIVLRNFDELRNHSGSREDLVEAAEGYVGLVNNRKTGNALFSNGRDEEWCADTVTTIVKDICGDKLPKDFGSASVSGLREWGRRKKAYVETSTMSLTERKKYVLNQIKPGDIMIEKIGKSHTGIVTEVYVNNKGEVRFKVLEGNMGSNVAAKRKVGIKDYPYNSKTLSGFIKMDKWLDDFTLPENITLP